ncbi:MAG TPA: histidinol dehydrogenase [bacterium]|nr:histidinol dehydrogenase [bacterium]
MKTLATTAPFFEENWSDFLKRSAGTDASVEATVRDVIAEVRARGDAALLDTTEKFDGHRPAALEVSRAEIAAAVTSVEPSALRALKTAAARIEAFHHLQKKKLAASWTSKKGGILLGEQVRPLDRVGIYVPGGLAAYPSTVLMNAIPARVAGVEEIIMVSPWREGRPNAHTLAAARLAGVTRVFKIGGAQAVAALAYGTASVPAVDKIVGPGNAYVAAAKRLLFGKVGIDMIAGPTEIAVVADEGASPASVAADLLSQAEHDPMAVAVLLTHSEKLIQAVQEALERQLGGLERRAILKKSIEGCGLVVKTRNLNESLALSNRFAPEHLSVQVRNARKALPKIRHAGAIFLGPYAPVAFGDYLAGPNHVLPTSGTARFSSPLGVSDFLKRSSLIEIAQNAFEKLAPTVIRLAELEGLTAHAASVRVRKVP